MSSNNISGEIPCEIGFLKPVIHFAFRREFINWFDT
jgi:hypothetical protein